MKDVEYNTQLAISCEALSSSRRTPMHASIADCARFKGKNPIILIARTCLWLLWQLVFAGEIGNAVTSIHSVARS